VNAAVRLGPGTRGGRGLQTAADCPILPAGTGAARGTCTRMRYDSLDALLAAAPERLRRGPVALIFVEDEAEIASTMAHHLRLGFASVLAFVPEGLGLSGPQDPRLAEVRLPTRAEGIVPATVNRIAAAAPGSWIFWGFNAEYLYFPFCETRSVRELVTFHAEERREAMLTFVIDLYPGDLARAPHGVSLSDAHLDRIGYYALARRGPDGHPRERQLDFFGGIRWRFEEHVPQHRRRIDRIALFRAGPGRSLTDDHRFDDEELNTYACPWHHNLTAAIASFRTAKALKANPVSAEAVASFRWPGSVPFEWGSQQLMDLGLMEPGQWF